LRFVVSHRAVFQLHLHYGLLHRGATNRATLEPSAIGHDGPAVS
jgi:hypothetical protein